MTLPRLPPSPSRRVRVAAAQVASPPGDIPASLVLHEAAILEARRQRVELLVFPELSLTGYESRPETTRLSRPAFCAELNALAEAAHGMTVVVGFMEGNGVGRPFNSCALLAQGRVTHVHRKLNLPSYGTLVEGDHYRAGTRLDLTATPLGPAACLICADLWNPALPWLAAIAGAELMIVPVASVRAAVACDFDSRENWLLSLRCTAMTYGVPIVMSNLCGAPGGLDFWGGSAVVDALGRVVAEAADGPELIVAELDRRDGEYARARLPTARDAAPDLVRGELDRLMGRRPRVS